MRSFRAEKVLAFVKALLDCQAAEARVALAGIAKRYPIALARDLRQAKRWILDHARGTERYGLVASSNAHRLKPDAIDIRVNVDPIHWFLRRQGRHQVQLLPGGRRNGVSSARPGARLGLRRRVSLSPCLRVSMSPRSHRTLNPEP